MIYDGQAFSNISATTAAFRLVGGYYMMDVVATFGGGTVKLQKLAVDGTTWNDVANSSVTAAGITAVLNCTVGSYRISIATATAVYVGLSRLAVG